jgi:SAM-dependent methyltransferase
LEDSEPGRVDLEELYSLISWPSRPGMGEAERRFQLLTRLFSRLISLNPLQPPSGKPMVKVLDVMAASGIAGVAFASALVEKGYNVELMVTDIRTSELAYARQWLERCKPCRGRVRLEYGRADATKLPEDVGVNGWDYILVWWSSLGHLGSHSLNLLLAGAADILAENGLLLVEQEDIGARLMLEHGFKPVYAGEKFLLIYKSYDSIEGTASRHVVRLPHLKYLGQDMVAFWRIAEIAGRMELLYEEVYAIPLAGEEYGRKTWILAARKPRRCRPTWKQLAQTRTKQLKT